jgi:alkanesulfonate monooxygenase SsuD/methylene tetrahydromethanopterin reductase-like flavin-dependent oxidoreductase (luciferase family)
VATLDYVSLGRAGWKVAVSTTEGEAAHFGRKDAAPPAELYAEAEEAVDVVVRLWDSWEDDAVIRDQPTGRYVDRDKLHYVDFEGRFFGVRGPSITPRPPQGHPVVAVDASNDLALPIAGSFADLVYVDALDADAASQRRREIRERAAAAGRDPDDVAVLATIDVVIERDRDAARATRARLDARGGETGASDVSSGLDFVGTPAELAALLEGWFRAGAVDGFTIRPAVLPHTLALLVDDVAPILRERGVFRGAYDGATLRDHFGLTRPPNRYAETA